MFWDMIWAWYFSGIILAFGYTFYIGWVEKMDVAVNNAFLIYLFKAGFVGLLWIYIIYKSEKLMKVPEVPVEEESFNWFDITFKD